MLDARVSYPETKEQTFRERCLSLRAQFEASGTSIADWSRERGFNENYVREVLTGKRACIRGQSHKIAVALGLKPTVPPPGAPIMEPEAGLEGFRQ